MLPDRPDDAVTEAILIEDGEDVPDVAFEVVVDGGPLSVTPRRGTVVALADGTSKGATFTLAVPDDHKAKSYTVYVQVYQKTQFLCVLKIDLNIKEPRARAGR